MAKATKAQVKYYSKVYSNFYENGYDRYLVDLGEDLMNRYPDIHQGLIDARQDWIVSDREIAAYAAWFMKYHNEELLKRTA